MIISVHVYDDGEIELTRHDTKPKGFFVYSLFVDDEETLRKELLSYGAEETRITEALTRLKTETQVTI